MATEILPGQEGDSYVKLKVPDERLHIEVQAVDHDSRVHLDIESDDIEAKANATRGIGCQATEESGTHGSSWKRRPASASASCGRRTRVSNRTRTSGNRMALSPRRTS